MSRYILQQDECAPDSLEHFEEQMKAKLGMSIEEFKLEAAHTSSNDCEMWMLSGYRLEIAPDHPWYTLAEVLK
ncbi:hypothetical protein [Idiomarina abyssalis]|uniref:Uncharacterized protein n=1 Tax=Idiomarina abyssalis TaxID=86102 RepID=A0A8I1KFA5_9GAMM|nr:hypothetical protein [Idiomarina abyssalis]MBJ7265555.1 hypothetical protein [Idiomarina abyssalis]MBJ7316771.1 hypothetical protein [Idiomarina abyssalis]